MKTSPTEDRLTFKVARDEPNDHAMELSLKPPNKEGYVFHNGVWRLARSNGRTWELTEPDEE